LVFVRSESWAGCTRVLGSLFGQATAGLGDVPGWVPLLVGFVAAGHAFSGMRGLRCGVLTLPAMARSLTYAAAVALIVVFGPGASKAFIYFQF
jgi:hypothetical protein